MSRASQRPTEHAADKTRKGVDWFPPEPKPPVRRRPPNTWLVVGVLLELAAAALAMAWLFGPLGGRRPAATATAVSGLPPAAPVVPTLPTVGPPPRLWLAAMPESVAGSIRAWATAQGWELVLSGPEGADVVAGWEKRGRARLLAEVVLVPVVALPVELEDVTAEELRDTWRGRPAAGSRLASAMLIVTPESGEALAALWGQPPAGALVATVPVEDVAGVLWNEAGPAAVAIVPFERLAPRLKALRVDGLSVLDRDLEVSDYPLRVSLWADRSAGPVQALAAGLAAGGPGSNRHPERLTTVAMTGVTGLTRGLALTMDAQGDDAWPARRLAGTLAAADVTHVSNEVSFLPGCEAEAGTMSFCARPEYMATLRLIGTDVVELTGNHNLDFGLEAALLSLDLYADEGMGTFGGGRDAFDARRPLVLEHNGNRLAFLGYNQFGPDYAWATEDSPGAAIYSLDAVREDLAAVRPRADVVFVNIQHTEVYSAAPLAEQVLDFRAVAEAGADVVTGSQAHQPQAVEFVDGRPIFYGLGNLFFDQTWSEEIRESLIVRHVIYEGRLIAVDLLPTIMGDDHQARLADGEERLAILRQVFGAGRQLAE